MTSMNDSEFPSSPQNDESDEEEQDSIKQEEEDEEDEPPQSNVASILARLQSSGALIKKPKEEYRCFPCDKDFSSWQDLDKHIITHVSLPSVVLDKLPSDEEDLPPSGDENWSDEDEDESPPKTNMAQTPQKIDISQILKKTGLSLKKTPNENNSSSSDSALNKLSGLGFTIKKNVTPIKKEKPDNEENDNVMQKLGKLGGIKLKLKSDGNNTNSFKVVNGLKDFKASDDENDGSANEDDKEDQDFDEDMDKSGENDGSEEEPDSDDEQINRKQSGNSDIEALKRSIPNLHAAIQGKVITPKKEPPSTPLKVTPIKIQKDETAQGKLVNSRPVVKQTPKRGVVVPIASKETQQLNETSRRPSDTSTPDTPRRPSQTPTPDTPRRPSQTPTPDSSRRLSQTNTPERLQLNDRIENVVVKQETQASSGDAQNNIPLFSGPIKSERSTPPLSERTTPILAHVKPEPEVSSTSSTQPLFSYQNSHSANTSTAITSHTNTLLPVIKTEDAGVTVIEINGDSNDEDDDCCVVSTTPAPDVKPIVLKDEKPVTLPPPYSATATPSYTKSQTLYNTAPASSSRSVSSAPSTEKQHNFNWNAPDSKPLDFLEKSTDDIFESLLSSSTKKENMSLSEASEYISLDTLGPQHSCDICNTRFTDVSLLEEHIRVTGHSKSIVARTSSLMPYDPSSSNLLLSSLLPVKQIAEQVGKLSTTSNSGPGFTHQQNVMINIQAYPGAGGVMVPPPQYNSYNSGPGSHGNYPPTTGNMYGTPPMTMPNQYPGTNFMPPGYGQYQPPMSKPGYPGTMPHNSFSMSSPQYSAASPLQSMQQAVYGQSMMNPPGTMGPPGSSPSHSYASTSSPGGLKQPGSGIKIQNVQTFPPGQIPGQTQPGQQMPSGAELGIGQMPPPSQPITGQVQGGTPIRMAAGANMSGIRPRMPSVRGQRPTIRPGIQVHGQVRGAKMGGPRMPLKRPGAMAGGPGQKRRPDMLLPGKHDNEDCQVMALQKQREGLPLIQSVQGAKDKLNLGSQISITKKPVNKEANAMANVLASRGISVKQKQKSRSPTPERPLPHIPNLGAGMSIKHTSRSSKFSIPEAKVGGGMHSCKICKKMFMNHNSLQVHISNAHPQSKIPVFKCDECPASYPKSLQLQHHKRVFHNVTGPNRELGLPVVDLSQEDNLKRLSSLGIYSFIPLANREQGNGCFGIPVISVHNMQNGLTSGLQALGADGLLSLGPLKPLPNS